MSRFRSESSPDAGVDPLLPSDHADAADSGADVVQPALGFTGWLRWCWRQLTAMRTALVLLLLLAIGAVPGSLVPQRGADPNGVTQYFTNNPELAPVLDSLGMFDVYTSPWFSAIYILLFVSLIGCVIPRTRHHFKALRARPPRTPARLQRLADHQESILEVDGDATAVAAESVDVAEELLKKSGYRVERHDRPGAPSVSAERGYLRETGNLVFHSALVGLLVAVGVGGALSYQGQTVILEGRTFTNALLDFTSFNPGAWVDTESLTPYSMTLEDFSVSYVPAGTLGGGQSGDFVARVATQIPGEEPVSREVRVNYPLNFAGDRIFLMGNGYAPAITIRNAAGETIFSEPVIFLAQDSNMTSLGVVKVADGLPEQMGLVGFFYPTQVATGSGAFTSAYPDLSNPVLSLDVYVGDLGIDGGVPRSVYSLDTSGMTRLTGGDTGVKSLEIAPGQTADLPGGYGTVTFDDISPEGATGYGESVARYVSLSVHRDLASTPVLIFAVIATLGLIAGLLIPRRRMWVRAVATGGTVRLEYAGLARGEDPGLPAAVATFARRHGDALEQRRRGASRDVGGAVSKVG